MTAVIFVLSSIGELTDKNYESLVEDATMNLIWSEKMAGFTLAL